MAPPAPGVSTQLPFPPAPRVPWHWVTPSLTMTLPTAVGVLCTWKLTVIASPKVDGSGVSLVIVVLVTAGATVWLSLSLLGKNSALPA